MKPTAHTGWAIGLLGALLLGCGTVADVAIEVPRSAPDEIRTTTEPGGLEPVTLYVSNQSFDDPSVKLTIVIDDAVVVNQHFAVEDQHNWVGFELTLSAGDHELVATSDSGLEKSFTFATVEGKPRWLVLDYWWYVGEHQDETGFTFRDSDEPVVFF